MISLAAEMTDAKGRHARGWLFFDAECGFCTRLARLVAGPMQRRGLALAPLQDPRVAALLALPPEELLHALRFLSPAGGQFSGAGAVVALAGEFSWARPLIWISKIPGGMSALHAGYAWVAHRRKCPAESCPRDQAAAGR
jgi:predicted DCC family thiol-disulfide oxidoreductase YuxK